MKKILLVDDDYLAHNAFFSMLDWRQYSLSIVYEAYSGNEAIEFLRKNKADFAFIDVCMPDMDGISLLQQIHSISPSITCIMLSSFSDYPYVREALKNGAVDYLLKHEMTGSSLISLLKPYGVKSIDPPFQDDAQTKFHRLLVEHTTDLAPLSGLLVLGYLNDGQPLINVQAKSVQQTCRHILNEKPGTAVCSPSAFELALLFSADESENAIEDVKSAINRIKKALQKYHHINCTFDSIKHCADTAQIELAYQLFHKKLDKDVAAEKPSIYSENNFSLVLAVLNHQKPLVEQLVSSIYKEHKIKNDIDGFGRKVISLILNLKLLLGINNDTIPRLPADKSLWESFAVRLLSDIAENGSSIPSMRYSGKIQQAMDYISRCYMNDVRLSDIAQQCCISSNHLSFLFKKETGENLISCLNQVRVYHAARMSLFDSLPISSICEKVGFKSYNHFFASFRSITGMTPSEFRKSKQATKWLVQFGYDLHLLGVLDNFEK